MKKNLTIALAALALPLFALDAVYVSGEQSIPYTPTADVSAGDVLVLSNGLVAVASRDIDSGALGSIGLRGIYKLAKDTSTTYVGQLVYWDEDGDQYGNAETGTGAATTTSAGNTWCGFAIEATGATDDTVDVMLYPVGNVDAATLTVAGAAALNGGITVDTSAFTVANTSGNTAIAGTLAVTGTSAFTGVATLTAAPALVSTNTAGAITLTMTNAPTAADAGKAAPAYINVTIGGVEHVIPAWPLAE